MCLNMSDRVFINSQDVGWSQFEQLIRQNIDKSLLGSPCQEFSVLKGSFENYIQVLPKTVMFHDSPMFSWGFLNRSSPSSHPNTLSKPILQNPKNSTRTTPRRGTTPTAIPEPSLPTEPSLQPPQRSEISSWLWMRLLVLTMWKNRLCMLLSHTVFQSSILIL